MIGSKLSAKEMISFFVKESPQIEKELLLSEKYKKDCPSFWVKKPWKSFIATSSILWRGVSEFRKSSDWEEDNFFAKSEYMRSLFLGWFQNSWEQYLFFRFHNRLVHIWENKSTFVRYPAYFSVHLFGSVPSVKFLYVFCVAASARKTAAIIGLDSNQTANDYHWCNNNLRDTFFVKKRLTLFLYDIHLALRKSFFMFRVNFLDGS